MRIVGTAGHVDHGKSTIVRALTGTDPDRWAAEKERGVTIDLGFGVAELPSGPIAFVDVPGHERFLGNMLAGVGAIDAVLLVVSAVEGWKPQSEEHLAIVELLGVAHGVVALSHADRVDADRLAAVADQVHARLADGPLAGAEVVPTAAPRGEGLDRLVAALDRVATAAPPPVDRGRPRLWVDRAFTIRGAGTVVTGTLTGGRLAAGTTLVTAPGGRASRVRAIQVHDAPRDAVGPGHRVALNLPDLAVSAVGRRIAVVEPERWHLAATVDAELVVLASAPRPIGRRGAHLLHTGTGAWAVRLQVLHGREVAPGARAAVRIHLPERLPLRPGDRFVLRDSGTDTTVGGGTILDLDPVLAPRQARPDLRWERVVAERGWVEADLLARLTGATVPPTTGRWVVSAEGRAALVAEVAGLVDAAGPGGLGLSALDERGRAVVDAGWIPDVVVERGRVRSAGDDALARHPWLQELQASPFRPPPPGEVPRAEVEALVHRGLVFVRDGAHYAESAVAATWDLLGGLGEAFTVSEVRVAMDTNRPHALALLAELDHRGLTRRDGSHRTRTTRSPRSSVP